MNAPGAPSQNGNAATVTALRAISAGAYTSIALAGYYTPGDGGGGTFTWQSGSFTDDGGRYIIPGGSVGSTTTTGAWVRTFPGGAADARWWGAIANGTRDCTAAIQAALWSGLYHIVIPNVNANYMYSRSMIIPSNTWLDIDPAAVIQQIAGTNQIAFRNANILYTSASDQNITFTGGIIDGNLANNAGTTPYFTGDNSWVSDPTTNTGTGSTALGANAPVCGVRGLLSFIGVTNLRVQNTTIINALQHSLEIEACVNPYTYNIAFNCPMADGIHTGGCTRQRHYDTFGITGDDAVTIVCADWQNSAPWSKPGRASNGSGGYGPPSGATQLNADATDATIDTVEVTTGSNLVKLTPGGVTINGTPQGTTGNVRRVTMRNLKGIAAYTCVGVCIVPEGEVSPGNHSFTTGTASEILLDGLIGSCTNILWGLIQLGWPFYSATPGITITDFTANNIKLGSNQATAGLLIESAPSGYANTIGSVTLSKLTIDAAQPSPIIVSLSSGGRLIASDWDVIGNTAWYSSSAGPAINILSGASVTDVSLSNIKMQQYRTLFGDAGNQTNLNITATGIHLFDVNLGFILGANGSNTYTTGLNLSASELSTDGSSGGGGSTGADWVYLGTNSSATVQVNASSSTASGNSWAGAAQNGGYLGFSSYTGAKISWNGECIPVDITANGHIHGNPNKGDRITSTTSDTATGLVVGLNVCTNAAGPVWAPTGVAFVPASGGTFTGAVTGTTITAALVGAVTGAASSNLLTTNNLSEIMTATGLTLSSGTATLVLSPRVNNLTLTAAATIKGAASGMYDGQMIELRAVQDSTGGRTIAFDTGTIVYGTARPALTGFSTAAGAEVDFLLQYKSADTKWLALSAIQSNP